MLVMNNLIKNSCFFHPLDQFEVIVLFLYWPNMKMPLGVSILTNFTMVCMMCVLLMKNVLQLESKSTVLNVWKVLTKAMYLLVKNMMKSNTTMKRYQYFTTLFFLFMFMIMANMVGLIPYSFTMTSSFVVTFFLALSHFVGMNIMGVYKNKWKMTNLFLPSGVPLVMAPFLMGMELVSYMAKVFSLSMRLFANMMSGHALLKILMGFSWSLMTLASMYVLMAMFPWVVVTGMMFLEGLIAFLQAYVFTILVTMYMNDVLVEH